MTGNKNKRRMDPMPNYEHGMNVHRIRFYLSQHLTEEEICIGMRMPLVKVRKLICEIQLLDGNYELV